MRLAFMGSPEFAVPALHALHGARHDIRAVYCQPPRPAGRGQALRPCPVHRAAVALGLEVRTPARLRSDAAEHAAFAALDLDAAVVAAYGLILPQPMLDAPRRGCLNIHASLLPRWRGAAPIQAAILAGDAETGITIMQMDAGLDTGPILLAEAVPIADTANAASLHDELAAIGARLVLRVLAEHPPARPQPAEGATYAPKLTRQDGRIDWTRDAEAIHRQVRALNPWPGTFTRLGGEMLKVLRRGACPGWRAAGNGARRGAYCRLRSRGAPPPRRPASRARGDGCPRFSAGPAGAARHPVGVMALWALRLEYDGRPFVGWQRQASGASVQEVLEAAAGKLNGGVAVGSVVAGRTDAGVHAEGQVAQIELASDFEAERLREALNFHLKPYPVAVLEAARAPAGWSARFSATRRCYRYCILNRSARPALLAGRVWHVRAPLDANAMHEAAQSLLGRHDFTSFRAAACQAKSPVRTLDRLDVARRGDMVEVIAEARSFLHHQVRNMVGTLKPVGEGRRPSGAVAEVLDARDRAAAGPTAPAAGLYLIGVGYDRDPFIPRPG